MAWILEGLTAGSDGVIFTVGIVTGESSPADIFMVFGDDGVWDLYDDRVWRMRSRWRLESVW